MFSLLLAISGSALINLLIWLVIIGLVFYVIWWALGKIGLPEPFNKIVTVILVLVAAILLINALLGLIGNSFIVF